MIGCREEAAHIREWVRKDGNTSPFWANPGSAPEGWKYLGSGCYRTAYLSPTGVVYKVHNRAKYPGQANYDEYRLWCRLRLTHHMPEGSRLPLMNCFRWAGGDDVNAMDMVGKTLNRYAGDDYDRYARIGRRISRELHLWDMHHGNLAVDEVNKLVVPIDLG